MMSALSVKCGRFVDPILFVVVGFCRSLIFYPRQFSRSLIVCRHQFCPSLIVCRHRFCHSLYVCHRLNRTVFLQETNSSVTDVRTCRVTFPRPFFQSLSSIACFSCALLFGATLHYYQCIVYLCSCVLSIRLSCFQRNLSN